MYWQARLQFKHENENGKVQKTSEQYLVEAESPTDAEVKVTEKFEGEDFSIQGIVKSKILEVI